MLTLAAFTNAINLVALAVSLWLGLYVVTRSRNSGTARLAAAALWVLAAYFFQGALSIKYQEFDSAWLRLLILFLIPVRVQDIVNHFRKQLYLGKGSGHREPLA